ncbi:MAG TPA: hypothetical protein VK508_19650 [Cyclobacteriaceae bacterium]|nr:hypothetical protein [Cyclobacteriaceae bacterium]
MKRIFLLLIVSLWQLDASAQATELARKSKYVGTKDYVMMAQEQKATKSTPEPWLRSGGLGPSNQKSLKLTSKGLDIKIKSTARECASMGIPNPVFFSDKKENEENNSIDFKITLDFEIGSSKPECEVGIIFTLLRAHLDLASSNTRLNTQTYFFTVSKNGQYDLSSNEDKTGDRRNRIVEFNPSPSKEEPRQITIDRYGPFILFSINGKLVEKIKIDNANYLMSADILAGYGYDGIKATVQKLTYEIFDMDYEGCISGNCQSTESIKRIKNTVETAFVSGPFVDGHCAKGLYFFPKGGVYKGALTNDAPPKSPYTKQ